MADEQQLLGLIVGSNQGVLAAGTLAGYPHLTNVLYVWDPQERIARVSTTADRVKARILGRDPRAALHVSGPHFWSYAVQSVTPRSLTWRQSPATRVTRELLKVHSAFYGEQDEQAVSRRLIDERRLVVRLRVRRVYGVVLENPPG